MGAYSNLGDFSTAQVIGAAAYSEFMIDSAQVNAKLGVNQHAPYLCIRTSVAPTVTADSLSIEVRCSATESGGTLAGTIKTAFQPLAGVSNAGSGVNEVIGTDARLLLAGAWIYQGQLPYQVDLRYIQLYYNQTLTSGDFTIDAWLNDGPATVFRGSQTLFSNVGNP